MIFWRYGKQLSWMLITIGYMVFIWLQSEYFNPQLIEVYAYNLDFPILLMLGFVFELLHLIEFGILFIFLIQTFKTNPNGEFTKEKMIICFILSLLYSLIDEIHQLYVPYRSFSFIDIFKNFIGIFIVYYIVKKRYKW
ncbi:VanZ family protein [Cytobacillus sp. Sa5YUA1]|uniref:VanZ family protein n=1 Tax=Cytobacillus stercorigallinarum TaxID=2762240 RepID=A0ABR8QU60_9BACI|nr:VanZ family protein [Cytobacillus stercorigallinarum]MBD7939076.1 VanZ family protein [Cytobacillus stercorigallinarum]